MSKFNLKILLLLSVGHCVVDIYQGALPVMLPFLKDKLGLTYTMAGVILIVANTMSSVLQPFFGFLSDKKGEGLFAACRCLRCGRRVRSSLASVELPCRAPARCHQRPGDRGLPPGGLQDRPLLHGTARGHRHVDFLGGWKRGDGPRPDHLSSDQSVIWASTLCPSW